MATPVGHALVALGIGRVVGPVRARWRYVLPWSALFAILPDFDFLPGILAGKPALYHQGVSHSLIVAGLVGAVGALFVRIPEWSRRQVFVLLSCSYASHLFLDLFGPDRREPYGIPLLWPLSDYAFLAPVQLLMGVHHAKSTDASVGQWLGGIFTTYNLEAIAVEILFAIAFVGVLWAGAAVIARRRTASDHGAGVGRRDRS